MAPSLAQPEPRANSAAKDLNITNINTKEGASSREIGLPLSSSFL